MSADKITISIESNLLRKIDRLVRSNVFSSRSKAFEEALSEKIETFERNRLARECANLNIEEEQALADEGLMA